MYRLASELDFTLHFFEIVLELNAPVLPCVVNCGLGDRLQHFPNKNACTNISLVAAEFYGVNKSASGLVILIPLICFDVLHY